MHYVYILRSKTHSEHIYIGVTADLKARLQKHNAGGSPHTSEFRPWSVETYHAFTTKPKATEFERYLKSGTGRAFINRRLL